MKTRHRQTSKESRRVVGGDLQVRDRIALGIRRVADRTNKPDTAFKQQRLKAWQPILTPKTVLPTLFIIAVLFGPIGGLLIWGSSLVRSAFHTAAPANLLTWPFIIVGERDNARLHRLRPAFVSNVSRLSFIRRHADILVPPPPKRRALDEASVGILQ